MADRFDIEAAGGVLWRPAGSGVEVALVHRPRYDDWSLPKGKLQPGEHPLVGAVREVREETGADAVVGRPLGELRYSVGGSSKRARYWALRTLDGEFQPGDEVDELVWLEPSAAASRLGYERELVERFASDVRPTWPLLVVRHASAGSRDAWPGDDAMRPLDELGQRQAHALAAVLSCYAIEVVVSADLERCVDTVAPYADARGIPVTVDRSLTEAASYDQESVAVLHLHELVTPGRPATVSLQGETICGLLPALCERFSRRVDEADTPKGGWWTLHFAPDADARPELVAVERFATA